MADDDNDGYDDDTGAVVIKPKPTPAPKPAFSFDGSAIEAIVNGSFPGATTSSAGSTDWVLRPEAKTVYGVAASYPVSERGNKPTTKSYMGTTPKDLGAFEGEYAKLIEDPNFESWLVTRGWAFNRNLITKDGRFNTSAGRTFWNWLGDMVAKNPDIQRSSTPETYANARYAAQGGDAAFIAAGGNPAAAEEEPVNPIHISTSKSTSYNTMPSEAAEAAVDQLARGLLGRMANDKELARYRKQINAFLKANPSVSTSRTVSNSETQKTNTTSTSTAGARQEDAVNVLEKRLRRGSEGMAFGAGKMIEDALTGIDRGL